MVFVYLSPLPSSPQAGDWALWTDTVAGLQPELVVASIPAKHQPALPPKAGTLTPSLWLGLHVP